MKKTLLISSVLVILLSLAVALAIPALAQGPEDTEIAPIERGAWEDMHEACEEGDWEEMEKAAEEFHGEDFSAMPCHDEGVYSNGGGSMGGGMMGGGWGRMM